MVAAGVHVQKEPSAAAGEKGCCHREIGVPTGQRLWEFVWRGQCPELGMQAENVEVPTKKRLWGTRITAVVIKASRRGALTRVPNTTRNM